MPASPGQLLAQAAAELPTDYFAHTQAEYQARHNLIVAYLQAIPDVKCPRPRGAFYVMCQLPVDNAACFARWLLADFELRGATLLVSPAAGFYATAELGRLQLHLAYVVHQDSINRAMDCLAAALKQYPGRHE